MSEFGLKFHHLGLAVSNEDQALVLLQGNGYKIGDKIFDPEQKVYLRFCTAETSPAIELIIRGPEPGPLEPILKRYNELIYHTCYEVDDLQQTITSMENANLRVLPIAERKPAILFNNKYVSFYKVMGFGMIELLEC